MAPTQVCNLDPMLRATLIEVIVNTVSDSGAVMTPGTAQNSALNWIIDDDAAYLCPNDPSLKTRYALAVFYFSTRGNRWTECSAPINFDDPASIQAANANCNIQPIPNSGSDAWLTPSDECQWGGIVCDSESGEVQLLEIGK